jgi:phosphatidylserine synthase
MNKLIYVIKKLYSNNVGLWFITGFIYVLLIGFIPWEKSQTIYLGYELFFVKVVIGSIITFAVVVILYVAYNLFLVLKNTFISIRKYAREYDEKNKNNKDTI